MKKEVQILQLKGSEYFTVEEASEFLNIQQSAIRNYLTDGKLITYRFNLISLPY